MSSEGQFPLQHFFNKIKEENERIVLEKSNKYKFDFLLDVALSQERNFLIEERVYHQSKDYNRINSFSIEKIDLGKNFSEEEKRVFKERVAKTNGKF